MKNKEVFESYGTEQWVIEENLCYLLQEYRELAHKGKWQDINLVGFVKQFMNEETLANVEMAEKAKIDRLEENVVDVIDFDL